MSIGNIGHRHFGPLFKRGINRKHRRRDRKKITNYKTYAWKLATG